MDDYKAAVGAHVRQARRERRLSQEELGRLVGASAATISDIERLKTRIPADELPLFSFALRKPLWWFFEPDVSPNLRLGEALSRTAAELFQRFPPELKAELFKLPVSQLDPELMERVAFAFWAVQEWDRRRQRQLNLGEVEPGGDRSQAPSKRGSGEWPFRL